MRTAICSLTFSLTEDNNNIVRKLFIRGFIFLLSIGLASAVISLSSNSALAHHKAQVLGDATASSQLVFPPVTSGQGLILPDSPLFFLDQFSQQVKLLFAFSSEQRAKVRAQIAGERLAELRIMLERQNPEGINVALSQLTKEVGFAAKELADAAAQGADVKLLAKQINEDIKFQRKLLNLVADQTSGVLKSQLKTARQSLKEAKLEVEDELPEDELENEINEGLADEIDNEVKDASESAKTVERALNELQKEASKSAAKSLKKREEAIEKAIEKRDEVLRKIEEKLLKAEEKKQEKLLKAQEKAAEKAIEAVQKAQEAARGFETVRDEVNKIINQAPVSNSGSSKSSGSDDKGKDSGSGSKDKGEDSGKSGGGDSGKSGKN